MPDQDMPTSEHDPRIAFFNGHAPTWDDSGPPRDEVIARLEGLAPTLALEAGQDVLEVGCGTGQVTPWLVQHVAPGKVTCIDFAGQMLERARTRIGSVRHVCADVCSDPLPRATYDAAFCMHCWPHFRDQAAAAGNLAAALRPGGRLIVLHLANWRQINAFHDELGGCVVGDHLPPPDAWTDLLDPMDLVVRTLADREDLFLLIAEKSADAT